MAEKVDVKKIAGVARISLTEKEAEKFQKDLEEILKAFEDIKAVNTKGVQPAFQPIPLKNITRPDNIEPSPGQRLVKVKNKENGYIKGPKVT